MLHAENEKVLRSCFWRSWKVPQQQQPDRGIEPFDLQLDLHLFLQAATVIG